MNTETTHDNTVDSATDEERSYGAVRLVIEALLKFDPATRRGILQTVATFFSLTLGERDATKASTPSSASGTPSFAEREDLPPKDFMLQKKPKTDVERVTCLAYYLTHYRNIEAFKTTDISKLNTEAAQIKLSNASNAVNNATQSGFLVPASRGAKQISAPGEKYVDALPDRTEARKIMSEVMPRRRRRANKANAGTNAERQA
ncbi:MAG: hypothetical protein F4Y26_02810 [Gammaproteobacteria bacterium]|nr:hypothetical protein [Gammaproteobacteria bacterium]